MTFFSLNSGPGWAPVRSNYMMSNLTYKINEPLSIKIASQFYSQSTLAAQRPSDYSDAMQQMLSCANLIVTAWDDNRLVGISRTMTDFCYIAYIADIAVHRSYQNIDMERSLILETQAQLAPNCMVITIATPAEERYFHSIGFTLHNSLYAIMAENFVYGVDPSE
jgi:hypothetical protein